MMAGAKKRQKKGKIREKEREEREERKNQTGKTGKKFLYVCEFFHCLFLYC